MGGDLGHQSASMAPAWPSGTAPKLLTPNEAWPRAASAGQLKSVGFCKLLSCHSTKYQASVDPSESCRTFECHLKSSTLVILGGAGSQSNRYRNRTWPTGHRQVYFCELLWRSGLYLVSMANELRATSKRYAYVHMARLLRISAVLCILHSFVETTDVRLGLNASR